MDARQIPYVDEYDMIGPSTCSSTSTKTKPCSPGAGSPLQSHNIRDCGVNKSGNSGESIPNYQVGTARGRGASKMSILSPGQARVNLTRFYGVFAGTPDRANSRFRSEVTPGGRRSQSDPLGKTQAERCRAMNWAQRLKRVFNIGITVTVYLSLDLVNCHQDSDGNRNTARADPRSSAPFRSRHRSRRSCAARRIPATTRPNEVCLKGIRNHSALPDFYHQNRSCRKPAIPRRIWTKQINWLRPEQVGYAPYTHYSWVCSKVTGFGINILPDKTAKTISERQLNSGLCKIQAFP